MTPFVCRICTRPCPRYRGPAHGWTCEQCIPLTTISGDIPMTRPYLPCTSPDCDRSTRAASRLCAIHRPSAVPTVTRSHNTISIGDRAFTPAEALELAERIADALAGENR